jgi:hypothetical protein
VPEHARREHRKGDERRVPALTSDVSFDSDISEASNS